MHEVLTMKKQNMFIYDCTGISRVATVVACYLSIYKQITSWSSLIKIEEHVKACHPQAFPNLRIVQKCIQENKEYQSKQNDYAF